jgi:hypothetical protein
VSGGAAVSFMEAAAPSFQRPPRAASKRRKSIHGRAG